MLPFVLKKMIDSKPPQLPLNDLEHSVSVSKIDIHEVANWADIFKEQKLWHWSTVKPPRKRKKSILPDPPQTAEELKADVTDWKKKFEQCG